MVFYIGETFRLYVNVKDKNGNLVDPTSIYIQVEHDGSVVVSWVSMNKESTGVYYYDVSFSDKGEYVISVKATADTITQIEKTTLHVLG